MRLIVKTCFLNYLDDTKQYRRETAPIILLIILENVMLNRGKGIQHFLESAKLRDLRVQVPTCFACLRCLVPTCLAHLHAYVRTCERANLPCVPTAHML